VIFTVFLGFVVLFWSSVILGGVDPNALDGDPNVHVDGGDADHGDVVHGDADHGDLHGGGVLSSMLAFLNFGSVPLSIIFSSMALFGWVSSMLLQISIGPWLASLMPLTAAGTVVFLAAGLGSLAATGLATRPLRGAFKIESRHAELTIVDCVCTILTSKVTENFGQATYETSGAPLNLSVRCPQANMLQKGSKAVIVGYDPVTNTYEVGELEPETVEAAASRESTRRKAADNADADEKKRLKEVREALRRAGAK
jgi:hypothetical protein